MAAPAYKNFTQAVLSDTGTISTPADTAIGDLVVVFLWSQSTNAATLTHTAQNGFTLVRSHSHDDGTTDGRLSVAVRVATAASTQSHVPFAIANGVAGQTCVGLITVTGADTTSPTTWTQNSVTNTGTQPPDPPSVTGLNYDFLVLAISGWHVTTAGSTAATVMANYTLRVNGPTGSHVTHLAVSTRAVTDQNNATEDPAAYGDNVTPNGSASMTIAIPMIPVARTYYVAAAGADTNNGISTGTAWKTIGKLNSRTCLPGDTILFNGGETFTGQIYITGIASGSANPVTFNSYGTGRATISNSVGSCGIFIWRMAGVVIQNLNFTGPGAATADKDGIQFYNDAAANAVYPYIRISNCTITGHQSGISLGGGAGTAGYSDIRIENVNCNANWKAGIQFFGSGNYCNTTVYIGNCQTYNNTGRAGQSSPSGSGIEMGSLNGATVELCVAYGNGASNNYTDGPIGIWCYSSNNVTIQKCESYNNLSAGGDGGGFDLDGGTTNSVIQYCYAHGNKGIGFSMFQYLGAPTYSGNIIRYNISESDQGGGLAFWGADASSKITDSSAYNNTVYASVFPACRIVNANMSGITVINNIFLSVGGVALVDNPSNVGITFTKNDYYPVSGSFLIWWNGTSYSSLAAWGQDTGGFQVDPQLTGVGAGGTVYPAALTTLTAYKISAWNSPMVGAGATITSPGSTDFWGDTIYIDSPDIGADETDLVEPPAVTQVFMPLASFIVQ